MGVLYGRTHIAEKNDSFPKAAPFTILIDRLAFDLLRYKIWLSIGSRAAIEQAGYVGVLEARENLPFLAESIDNQIGFHAFAVQLDRYLFLKFRVSTHCQISRSHTAGTKLADEFVGSYAPADFPSAALVFGE
jgi:hypothetical protein